MTRRGPGGRGSSFVACLAALVTVASTATISIVEPVAAQSVEPTTPAAQNDPAAPQEPFLCTTEYNGLGQPKVDNHDKAGTPVYPELLPDVPDRAADPIGWSEQCQAEERVEYRYRSTDGSIKTLATDADALPADVATLAVTDLVGADDMHVGTADTIPYLFRYQRGTLPDNRFIYSIAMLVPFEEVTAGRSADGWNHDHWNRRLIYSFGGGVGIGHSQGDLDDDDAQLDQALRLGHAVVYSSGTRTSTHYNLLLGGRTAVEVKARFVDDHAAPRYTVGVGASGGGIQQYVYAQNQAGLLDGLIPMYSFPDMTTQTINIGDCELLERFMDVDDADNPRWQNWDNRKIIEGQNSIAGFESTWTEHTGATGSSECIEGWRGSTPLALNPNFGLAVDEEKVVLPYLGEILAKAAAGEPAVPEDFPDLGRLLRTSEDPSERVYWTHWDDAAEGYGINPDTGTARSPWDNTGVQYGLRAVASDQITPAEFLKLNAQVGGWKAGAENVPESCGLIAVLLDATLAEFASQIGLCTGDELDQYSARQMTLSTDPATPAPRTQGDVVAITNAFERGLEFDGKLARDVPILDVRRYLEDELDMHNAQQSFVVRERIERAMGNADNHVVWFLDARPGDAAEKDEAPLDAVIDERFEAALRVMDLWTLANLADTDTPVGDLRPADAVDSCWHTDGTEIASGDDVWDGASELIVTGAGAWTDRAPDEIGGQRVGRCAAAFPLYSTSRIVAGGPITNDIYKCALKTVDQAIEDGDYGTWTPTAEEHDQLKTIFRSGVCDWSKRSVGYPGSLADTGPRSFGNGGIVGSATTEGKDRGVPWFAVIVGAIVIVGGVVLVLRGRGDRGAPEPDAPETDDDTEQHPPKPPS